MSVDTLQSISEQNRIFVKIDLWSQIALPAFAAVLPPPPFSMTVQILFLFLVLALLLLVGIGKALLSSPPRGHIRKGHESAACTFCSKFHQYYPQGPNGCTYSRRTVSFCDRQETRSAVAVENLVTGHVALARLEPRHESLSRDRGNRHWLLE